MAGHEQREDIKLPYHIEFQRGGFAIPVVVWIDGGNLRGQVDYQTVFQVHGYDNVAAKTECFRVRDEVWAALKEKFGDENIGGTDSMGFSVNGGSDRGPKEVIKVIEDLKDKK